MFNSVVLEDTHHSGHCHTIVRAESSAFCFHPVSVHVGLNGVGLEIMGRFLCLLRNHVYVALHHHHLAVFVAFRGCFAHDDISSLVFEGFDIAFLGPIQQELLSLFQMAARAWYLSQ